MVPPSARFPTRRAALAEEAARRALAGLGPELVLPQLRAQTVQELLAQPGGAGCELCGTLQTLTGALTQCVRRRPGWLYAMFPSGITCPVPARPALVQAAVLEALRPVLACGGQAVLDFCYDGKHRFTRRPEIHPDTTDFAFAQTLIGELRP